MKLKIIFPLLALLCGITANAQTNSPSSEAMFKEGFSFDVFGAYSVAEHKGFDEILKTSLRHGKFGAGIGANYFFTKNIGVGSDALVSPVDDITGRFVDYVSASAIVRLPSGRLAPYALGGVTRNWDADRWGLHSAIGLEVRVTERIGGFTEARYLFERPGDSLQFRAGIRINL